VGALALERLEAAELTPPPIDHRDWLTRRADQRGISLEEIL
jgi:hypothetical protein